MQNTCLPIPPSSKVHPLDCSFNRVAMFQVGNKTCCGLDLDRAVAQRSFLYLAPFFRGTQPFLHHLHLTSCTGKRELGSTMLSAGPDSNCSDSLSDFTRTARSLASWQMTDHVL